MAHLALHFPVTNKKMDSNFLSEFIERKELLVRLVFILLEYCFNYWLIHIYMRQKYINLQFEVQR